MKYYKNNIAFLPVLLVLLLSACQILPNQTESFSYSHYYLWLKTLSTAELTTEISTLKQSREAQKAQVNDNGDIKLLLLHSLPNSPIYQPYRAKMLLNQYPLSANNSAVNDNLALMILLKDQLNAQLLLLEKHEQVDRKNQLQLAQQTILIQQLKKQLTQLKKIEKNINEHK